jgi:uncharacterized protein (DUF697 family)
MPLTRREEVVVGVSSIAALGDFWKVVREFNPEGIEREAFAPIDIWILGEPGSGRHTLARSILGPGSSESLGTVFRLFDLGERADPLPPGDKPDLILLAVRLDREMVDLTRQMADVVSRYRVPSILVFTHPDTSQMTRDLRNTSYRTFSFISYARTLFLDARDVAEVQERLMPVVLEAVPSLRTPLARRIPSVRHLVADQIIAETAKVNAQFALVSNLPSSFLFFGGVAGSVADFFVLTKNQVMMVLRLAAIHGRDVAMTRQFMKEVVPVIGNAFVWRSVARTATGMLPTFVAAVPKATIAYAGTYAMGQAARFYFEHGRKPPREPLKQFGDDGARLFRRLARGEGKNETTP